MSEPYLTIKCPSITTEQASFEFGGVKLKGVYSVVVSMDKESINVASMEIITTVEELRAALDTVVCPDGKKYKVILEELP